MANFQPEIYDTTINIPVAFEHKGGRGQDLKAKIISTLIVIGVFILGECFIYLVLINTFELWQVIGISFIFAYILLFIERFFIGKELRYSDMYEALKRMDYQPDTSVFWKIFDIDFKYPYICYYSNKYKGIFVRMERGPISGKDDTAVHEHYEKVSNAYNIAHSLNMNMVHLDYMDSVGNDNRLTNLEGNLAFVQNPDMIYMLSLLYSNLREDASHNYASHDVYLFLSKDKADVFLYNVKQVVGTMVGGNFISYSILNRNRIRECCLALWNLHDLSIADCCETVLTETNHKGVVPISIYHSATNEYEELGKTVAEKERLREEARLKAEEEKRLEEKRRRERRRGIKPSNSVSKESVEEPAKELVEDTSETGDNDLDLF